MFLLEQQLAHFLQADSKFALGFGLLDLEIQTEAAFEISSSCNLAQKPPTPRVVESCSELGDEFPFLEFFRRSFLQGKKIGLLIDMFKIFRYQRIMQNGGKAYRNSCAQFC